MSYLTNYEYFTNGTGNLDPTNWGRYQYLSLREVVNAFMLNYTGDESLINNVKRTQVIFHAKRAVQELNYDALRVTKSLELSVGDALNMILPPDYVNWVGVYNLVDGKLSPLKENKRINRAVSYQQTAGNEIYIDGNTDDVVIEESQLDDTRVADFYGTNDTENTNNVTFLIDKAAGVINFSSGASGLRIVLEYVTDGLENGNDAEIVINKLAEDFIYSYIRWAILDNKLNVQEYIVRRARDQKNARLRNAKIRMSNLHPSRIIGIIASRGK